MPAVLYEQLTVKIQESIHVMEVANQMLAIKKLASSISYEWLQLCQHCQPDLQRAIPLNKLEKLWKGSICT